MRLRFHRNIAASSFCNVPQRPPAVIRSFTSIQMVHTHMEQNNPKKPTLSIIVEDAGASGTCC